MVGIFYPAMLHLYVIKRKRFYCAKFIQTLSKSLEKAQFWRKEEDRMRSFINFKFSFSSKMQIGYIDLLDTRLTSDSFEGPKFPLTLVLSGAGKYNNPYMLDFMNDPIIKSVALKLQNQKLWKKFVKNLNTKLSAISLYSFNWDFKDNLFKVLSYIDLMNNRIFVTSQIKITVWIVEISFEYIDNYYTGWRDTEASDQSENILLQT